MHEWGSEWNSHSVGWSTNQSINHSINQSANQSINQSLNQSITHSFTQSINQSITQSVNQTINQSLNQSIHQTNNQFDWVVTLSLQMKSRGISIMKDKLCILSDGTNKIPFYVMKLQIVNVFLLKMTENSKNCHFHLWKVLCTIFLNF